MSWLREVTRENPMFAEMRRPLQRFQGGGPSAPLYRVVILATIIGYFTLAAVFSRAESGFEPVVAIEMVVLAFLVPPMMFKTIAGERDKRSWDILLSAPVTPSQIVVGRFALGAMGVVGIVLLGTLMAPFTWPNPGWDYGGGGRYQEGGFTQALATIVSSQLYVLAFGLALVAIALFVSARSRRGFTALASTYGLFFSWLVLLPIVLAALTAGADYMNSLVEPLLPFNVAVKLAQNNSIDADLGFYMSPTFLFGLSFGGYLLLTVGMLYWASQTLHFPDNEIRFLARKHRA